MIIPRFIAVFGFVVAGWLTGLALREMFTTKWLETLTVVLLLACYVLSVVFAQGDCREDPRVCG